MSAAPATIASYWEQLVSQQPAQVAAALSGLLAGLHTPSTLEHVRQLMALLQRSTDPTIAGPTLTLLARWARQRVPLLQQQTAPGAAGKEADAARGLLQQAVHEALKVIAAGGVQQGAGPAAALLLGSAAAGCPTQLRWQVTEALGSALLAQASGRDSAAAATQPALPPRELIWSLAGLLPALLDTPVAACWVLSALLSACQLTAGAVTSSAPGALADALAPCYAMMRAVAGATLSKAHPREAVPQLLQPLATVLMVAVGEATPGANCSVGTSGAGAHTSEGSGGSNLPRLPTPPLLQEAASWGSGGASGAPTGSGASALGLPPLQRVPWTLLPPAAAAVLCLGGLLEGVCRAAPGFEPCQAVIQEAEDALLRAAKAASAWDLESLTPQGPASSWGAPCGAAEGRSGEGAPRELPAAAAALLRDCVSLSCIQAFQACGRPAPSPGIMHCQAGTLLWRALSLDPFFELAASGVAPATANALLARQLALAPMEHAAELAGAVARAAGAADYADRAVLVGRFREAAQRAYHGYQVYTLNTSGGFLGAVDSQAVRSILDKLFMSATVVLSAVWATELAEHASALQWRGCLPASGAATAAAPRGGSSSPATPTGGLLGLLLGDDDPAAATAAVGAGEGAGTPLVRVASPSVPALAAELLAVFADLQFARLPLDLFGNFLKEALAAVSGDANAAQALAACFPPYNELSAPCEARAGAPAWLMDAVVAAKVQFLMSVLMPCCHLLSEPTILEHLAPLSFLYLLHPHPPASAAAHQFFAALLPAVSLRSREPLAAFYIERTLEGYPGATALEPLQQGLVSMLCALPEGSSMSLYCIEAMLRKCRALEAGGRDPELVVQLFGLAAGLLLVIDYSLLRSALSAVGSFVEGGGALGATRPASASAALLAAVYEVLATTDDATRKPEVVLWYQQLAAGVAKQRHK